MIFLINPNWHLGDRLRFGINFYKSRNFAIFIPLWFPYYSVNYQSEMRFGKSVSIIIPLLGVGFQGSRWHIQIWFHELKFIRNIERRCFNNFLRDAAFIAIQGRRKWWSKKRIYREINGQVRLSLANVLLHKWERR
jgi:hypothetical protein